MDRGPGPIGLFSLSWEAIDLVLNIFFPHTFPSVVLCGFVSDWTDVLRILSTSLVLVQMLRCMLGEFECSSVRQLNTAPGLPPK